MPRPTYILLYYITAISNFRLVMNSHSLAFPLLALAGEVLEPRDTRGVGILACSKPAAC